MIINVLCEKNCITLISKSFCFYQEVKNDFIVFVLQFTMSCILNYNLVLVCFFVLICSSTSYVIIQNDVFL